MVVHLRTTKKIELTPASESQIGGVRISRNIENDTEEDDEPVVFAAKTVKQALETVEAGGESIPTDLIDSLM